MKKIKEFLKKVNPYMLASAAIIIVSFFIILWLLWDGMQTPTIPVEEVVVIQNETTEENVTETSVTENVHETVGDISELIALTDEGSIISEQLDTERNETTEMLIIGTGFIKEEEQEKQPFIEAVIETAKEEVTEAEPSKEPDNIVEPEESKTLEQTLKPEVPAEVQPGSKEPESVQPEPSKECGHSFVFESYYQEPTCSSGGLETQVCVHCGESQTTPGTPTGAHKFETETKGDCVSEEVVICKECNYRETGSKNSDNHIDVEDGFCYGCGQKVSEHTT